MNPGVDVDEIKKHDEEIKLYLLCTQCNMVGCHYRLLTPAACSRRNKSANHLDCVVCEMLGMHEEDLNHADKIFYVWVFLQRLNMVCGSKLKLITELRPLRRRGVKHRLSTVERQHGDNSSYLSFDFCVHTFDGVRIDLFIEIDGEQHISKGMHGRTVDEQRAIDNEKDVLVLKNHMRLLRLQYKDVSHTSKWFREAVDECKAGRSFVMYSYSYNKPIVYGTL